MANQTLLQLVDNAWNEMALGTAPTTVISNTDSTVVQLLALINAIGQDLVSEHQWQAITKEYRFTTVFYQYTATLSTSSTTITALSSTTGLTTNPTYFAVTGTGIPQDTFLVSVNAGASTAVLSNTPTTAGTAVTLTFSQVIYAMPSDYDRLVDDTEWDKTDHWGLIGPSSAQGWQWLKSGYIATGPRLRFRVLADKFQVWPPMSSTLTLGFEYVRAHWILATGAADVSKATYTADTDTCVFSNRLMIETLKLRMAKAGGFDFLLKTFTPIDIARGFATQELSTAKTADASSPKLWMATPRRSNLITEANIPDANFNL